MFRKYSMKNYRIYIDKVVLLSHKPIDVSW